MMKGCLSFVNHWAEYDIHERKQKAWAPPDKNLKIIVVKKSFDKTKPKEPNTEHIITNKVTFLVEARSNIRPAGNKKIALDNKNPEDK